MTGQSWFESSCRVVNDDLLQCLLFDGNTLAANLIGVEYIGSERLFGTLPEQEKPSWHPHNFEVLSGRPDGQPGHDLPLVTRS